jgi:hypothetical protein
MFKEKYSTLYLKQFKYKIKLFYTEKINVLII